jgi:hypothetical protein
MKHAVSFSGGPTNKRLDQLKVNEIGEMLPPSLIAGTLVTKTFNDDIVTLDNFGDGYSKTALQNLVGGEPVRVLPAGSTITISVGNG